MSTVSPHARSILVGALAGAAGTASAIFLLLLLGRAAPSSFPPAFAVRLPWTLPVVAALAGAAFGSCTWKWRTAEKAAFLFEMLVLVVGYAAAHCCVIALFGPPQGDADRLVRQLCETLASIGAWAAWMKLARRSWS